MIKSHSLRHVEHVSAVRYADLVADFEASVDDRSDAEVFGPGVEVPAQDHDLVTVLKFDQERWLSLYGNDIRSCMYLYDDPSATQQLLTDDLRVAVHLPFRLQIYEGADGLARISYDLPSDHLARLGNDVITSTARRIDDKVVQLIERITRAAPHETSYPIEYREHVSDRPYSKIVEDFESIVGAVEGPRFRDALWTSTTAAEWEAFCKSVLGTSGFLRLLSEDYGQRRQTRGDPGAGKTYIYGNPILARALVQNDVRIGELVPARLTIFQHAGSAARIGYDHPASLLSRFTLSSIDPVAAKTGDGLSTFIEMLTGATA